MWSGSSMSDAQEPPDNARRGPGTNLLEVYRLARPHHWKSARQWLLYLVAGGCLPFWGPPVVLGLFEKVMPWDQVTGRGELALFGAGVIASAIPLMRRRVDGARVEYPEYMFFGSIVLLMVSGLLLATVTISETFPGLDLSKRMLVAVSVFMFLSSVLIGFAAEIVNSVRTDPDIMNLVSDQEEALRKRFLRDMEGANG